MKKHLVFSLGILLGSAPLFSQTNTFPASGSVGIGTTTPHSSALLDITSTALPYKGILIPRLTQAQRTQIVTPATGLLIYQTNATPGFYYYTGAAWTPVTPAAGANRNLSNLLATSVNQHLVAATNNSRDLGSNAIKWRNVYLYNLRFPDATTQSTAAKIYTGGTGISIAGSTITNTAPDQTVTLTQGGATTITGTYPNFTISSTDNNTTYTAGSGLSLTGTTFDNTAPDQPVILTQGGATTITGTYPNFTISSTDNNTTYSAGAGLLLTGTEFSNTAPDQIVTLTGSGSTTVSGTYPNFTINSTGGLEGWSLNGNVGTTDGTNFIGTTDAVAISFRVNNENAGRIDPGGSVFLGIHSGNVNTDQFSTGVGAYSLYSNTIGNGNTAGGYYSLYSNTLGYQNSAVGMYSLWSNTEGNNNSALGLQALSNNLTGSENTAIGNFSMANNVSGSGNTGIGYGALSQSGFGNYNTAVGYNANISMSVLTNATAIGYNSLVEASNSLVLGGIGIDAVKVGIGLTVPTATLDIVGNIKIADGTQGEGKVLTSDADGLASWTAMGGGAWSLTGNADTDETLDFIGTTNNVTLNFRVNNEKSGRIDQFLLNTSFGYQAGNTNGGGTENTSIGYQALYANGTGNNNTATGSKALFSLVVGNNNTAYGSHSLFSNSFGVQNTAVGSNALLSNTIGNANTAMGFESLYSNTEGLYNTAFGQFALYLNATGNFNTAVGGSTMNNNTTGSGNAAFGSSALIYNTEGMGNTAIGLSALTTNLSGDFNTALGYQSNVSDTSLNNSCAIGANTSVDESNKMRMGNSSVTSIGGEVGWTTYSDVRIKENIQENVPGLEFINALRPVTYYFNVNRQNQLEGIADTVQWEGKYDIQKMQFTGFIAQEVEAAAQSIEYDFSGVDKSGTLMGLRYSEFVVPLVQAAQELDSVNIIQNEKVIHLESIIGNQQAEIDELKDQITLLTSTINSTVLYDGVIQLGTQNPEPGTQFAEPMLGQNIPNPYNHSTLIPFRIPKDCKDASIMITSVSEGKVITVIPISCTETHISFEAGQLASGTYAYSLIVDGKIVDTKEMILTD